MPLHPDALRVLVVDHEPLVCWALAETLTAAGILVAAADSAAAAVQLLAHAPESVDVVLLDFLLPDSDDFQLLRTVKRIAPQVQVILVSAFLTRGMTDEAFRSGACRVLNKPLEMHEAAMLVRDAARGVAP